MKRPSLEEQLEEAAAFLCGDDSAWVTGETISVDGVQHLRGLHSDWNPLMKRKQGS